MTIFTYFEAELMSPATINEIPFTLKKDSLPMGFSINRL